MERHYIWAPKGQSRLEQLRSEYQEKTLREKEEKLLTLFTQQQESALRRVHGYSQRSPTALCAVPRHPDTSIHSEPKQVPSHPNFHPSPGTAEKTWASNWTVAKKSVGVDRAHPLKPVFHHKATVGITAAMGNLHLTEFHGRVNGRSPSANALGLKPSLPVQVRSKSGPSRPQPWHQLQEAEVSLNTEIRRKEALLKEKLRRTEEELRRIQREKVEAELEERSVREIQEGRRRADKIQRKEGPSFSHLSPKEEEQEDDGSQHMCVGQRATQRRRCEEAESKPHTGNPRPTFTERQNRVGRLKREQLVASNSKIHTSPTQPVPPKHVGDSSVTGSLRAQHVAAAEQPGTPSSSKEEEEGVFWGGGYPQSVAAEGQGAELVQCRVCQRQFASQRLEKHTQVCKKMQSSRRKVFDSSKARAKGTDLEQYLYTKGRVLASAPM
ncbi:hypothetical protein FKM82_017057, partial [Ascaphus truei]